MSEPSTEMLRKALAHPLDHTEFDWGRRYEGKVRDVASPTKEVEAKPVRPAKAAKPSKKGATKKK